MVLAGLALAATAPVSAQDSALRADARSKTQQQGTAAMERLKRAVAHQVKGAVTGPTALPTLPEAARRRAFDGLRARTPDPAMETRARAALQTGKDAFAAQREAMAQRLRQALGLDAPDVAAVTAAAAAGARRAWVPVLFASPSMPIATLRNYAGQLEQVGGVMAFRGMPGGMQRVAPMARLSAQILRIEPDCDGPACTMRNVQLIVDPLVFRQHGVSVVPALGLIPGDPTQPYCERDGSSPASRHIIYGDAALSGMLAEYARLGASEEVRDVQARLQGR
ncbi:type-F conjugative transfer system pilin assembly protein TrbC [Novosphingobium sp.]|uniref:type-F conjugative transfer system pilin assembly protein TrbC n=1 Tax=Novosphingobium sp. TaxID=1874826 RepID=UPI0038B78158